MAMERKLVILFLSRVLVFLWIYKQRSHVLVVLFAPRATNIAGGNLPENRGNRNARITATPSIFFA